MDNDSVVSLYDSHQYDTIAFNIGWDFAAYGLHFLDPVPKAMMDGYRAAKIQRVSRRPDRYINKWLYIRMGAFKRKRIVADHITPELIRVIDEGLCPITRQKFTYGTMAETDWSVDRVNNDGAYAIGNICVMSTKANLIKGTMSSQEITDLILTMMVDGLTEYKGLTLFEWKRLGWLSQKCDNKTGWPIVMLPPPLIHVGSFDRLLCFFAMHCFHPKPGVNSKLKKIMGAKMSTTNKLFKAMSNNIEALMRMEKSNYVTALDIYQLTNVYKRAIDVLELGVNFKQIFALYDQYYSSRTKRPNVDLILSAYEGSNMGLEQLWRTDSKGYLDGFNVDDSEIKNFLDLILPHM